MKMVNVTQMQIITDMLNVVAKCRGSVTGKSDPILLSSCFPISILNSVCVFFLWLLLHLPSLSPLLLHLLKMSLVCFHFSLLCLCFHLYFHFSSFCLCFYFCVFRLCFCTCCSFRFHSFFLKNGSAHEANSVVLCFLLSPLLCLTNM